MRNAEEFRQVVRNGIRAGRPTVVVHASQIAQVDAPPADGSRVGFVVSKAVGNAVTRNRVRRRLRHLTRALLVATPPGSLLVVRALPRSVAHPQDVAHDLARAWTKVTDRLVTPSAADGSSRIAGVRQ